MDSDALAKQKVECLQKELERLRKANEALNFALGVMSMKNLIISRETNTNSQVGVFLEGSDLNCNSNKRARADLQARAGLGAPSTTQTYVRTGFKDQALMAKDGYRWRKYGQKITKDNQYPRAYFNCSSRGCPVKKKVQRSLEDKSMVMVSYQDQHNHECDSPSHGSTRPFLSRSSPVVVHCLPSTPCNATVPLVSLDLDLTLALCGGNKEDRNNNL
ncbi:WRKY transcription factor WRKY76-like [Momordica charantia]|uniref:WRKY transcription factor WRKY76-like n=1 Tax=Momordica charantia TaxID=3673 RepID=A0A6J1BS37_MOMCH|nr:WRKY transcription factor WRKY76-like [Momordica charantia]